MTSKSVFIHPSFGEVESEHSELKLAQKLCADDYFSSGVTIDGKLVAGERHLCGILRDYRAEQFERLKNNKPTNSGAKSTLALFSDSDKDPSYLKEI
ncbi:hypothetical protein J7384_16630 [Endozoicomonas sp. G2_1]|uniref:hypothetical protein n=1 Tax=Endozoicomonas sp. G2_1 TaxID=2821091 RepID=UPI001ADA065E|nr:hypothetical protein [Endozoicomonas sp. G2_1]MBO9491988.1 hypothetical protein [Endozoicomonas sp. G2_1]